MTADQKARLQRILDALNDTTGDAHVSDEHAVGGIVTMHEAHDALMKASASMTAALAEARKIMEANGRIVAQIRTANAEAIALLNELPTDDPA
jgi:flagellar hook-basal body complex protein FliE